jgi:acetoin utilization deacetylase AcuC-like enzyme
MKGQLYNPTFLEICDLHPVLAIHKQEYVNDLIQLTLNQKAARKIGSSFKELIERELRFAQGTILLKNLLTQSFFNIGGTHHAYSTHGEAFVC